MKQTVNKLNVLSIIISIGAIVISISFSIISFILPLIRSRLVVEDPREIYIVTKENENFDEIIIPMIYTNYGNYIRTITNIEAFITKDQFKFVHIQPVHFYDQIFITKDELPRSFYSSYIITGNTGSEKYVGFKFDPTVYKNSADIPSQFHFEPNELYTVSVRIYTTRNSFMNNDREVIQVTYRFKTRDNFEENSIYNISSKCFFSIN